MKEGCGRFRLKVASLSPLTLTLSRFVYQDARGFLRKSSGSFPDQLVPSALHVLGGERFAVVPLDALPELERELGLVRIPGPAFGQVGNDVGQLVLLLLRIEHHQIVEDAHHRHRCRDGGFLVDRHAGRAVAV